MSDEAEPVQIWVRTDKALVYGPLTPTSVELLIDNGVIGGRVQVSTDGINYVFPGRMPGIRVVFPRTLWGDTIVPGDEQDAAWAAVTVPPPLPGSEAAAAMSSPSGIARSPGVVAPGGKRGPTLVAGPGARAQADQRALHPAHAAAQARAAAGLAGGKPAYIPGTPQSSPSGMHQSSPSGMHQSSPSGMHQSSQSGMHPSSQSGMHLSSPSGPHQVSQSGVLSPSAVQVVPGSPSGVHTPGGLFDDLDSDLPPARTSAPSAIRPPPAAAPPAHAAPAHGPPPVIQTPPPFTVPAASSGSGLRAKPPSGSRPAAAPPVADPGSAMPSSGSLAQYTPVRLYFLAASQDLTGQLTLTLADRMTVIHFRKGNPELIDSNHPDDLLHTFLVRQQLATFDQIGQADREKARFGGELLAALFGLGLLNPNNVFSRLAQRSSAILGRALLAEAGTFTFEVKDLPPAKAMPLGNKWAVLMEQLRHVPGTDARRRMMAAMDLPIMKSGSSVQATDMRLTPQEARALTFFDGVHSLNQLVINEPSDADVILRTAWILRDCDLVSFAATPARSAGGQPHHASAPPPGVAPVGASAAPPHAAPHAAAPPPGARQAPARPAAGAAPGNPVSVPGNPVSVPGNPVSVPGNPASVPGNPVRAGVPGNPVGLGTQRVSVPYPGMKPTQPMPPQRPPPPVMTPSAAAPPPARPAAPHVTPSLTPIASAPPAAPAAASAVPPTQEVSQLMQLLAKMQKQNHFEVLDVKRKADSGAIKSAYFKLARSFHPDTVPADAPPALAKLKADLFARVGDAHRTLSDPKLRAEYESELDAGGTGEKVDVSAILAAEELFQRGCILVKARKYADAVKMLDDAIKASPEGEYFAWRGYAKFFTFPDKQAGHAEAMKDIQMCLQKNQNVAAVHYFQGSMLKLLGQPDAAKKHFKKCIAIDPKHIDAQRELRLAK